MRIMRMFLFAALVAASVPAMAQAKWDVIRTMHIGGEGGWDYLTVYQQNQHLFVTRSTHTQVIDGQTGKLLGDIPGQIRSHGTAIVPAVNRGFITDGGGKGQIVVFDLNSYKVLGKIPALPDADGIIYDRGTNQVLAVSGDEGKLMIFKPDVDPNTGQVNSIELGGKPEFLAADGQGKAFINLEDKGLVAEVDLKEMKVLARWPVAPGGQPVGMSLDRKDHLLFIGCRNPQKMIVMSTDDGKVVADLPIGAGVDATKFAHGQAFASCRDGSLTVASQKDGKWQVEQVVETHDGARTMGIDSRTNTIYLPTADSEPQAPGTKGRPKMKPDSFMIVVVGKK